MVKGYRRSKAALGIVKTTKCTGHRSGVMMPILNLDALSWLRNVPDEFDLVFCDPPFNIGQKYGSEGARSDNMPADEFCEWTETWMKLAWSKVRPGGVMVVHGSREMASGPVADALYHLPEAKLENEIIWHFAFGQNRDTNWVDSFCRAVVLRKPGSPKVWRPDANLIKSERLKAGDKRVLTSKRQGWVVPGNVWYGDGLVRIQGNNSERWDKKHGALFDHPNQLPQLYCARFVRAYTTIGGSVLDCFCGSGTMPLVCRRIRRDCVSLELHELTADSARLRLTKGFVREGLVDAV